MFIQLLGFSFGFDPTSEFRFPSGFCSHPERTGLKKQLTRELWLTHARVRVGYGSYNWNAGLACGGRGWHDVATA